jgi:hypothetical protein
LLIFPLDAGTSSKLSPGLGLALWLLLPLLLLPLLLLPLLAALALLPLLAALACCRGCDCAGDPLAPRAAATII